MYFPKMDPVFWAFTTIVRRKYMKICFAHEKKHIFYLDVRETQMMIETTNA